MNTEQSTATSADAPQLLVSDSAIARVASMREKQGNPNLMLRVTVLGGGCSGFKYTLEFDDQKHGDDIAFRGTIVTDESSLQFIQNLMGSAFKIKNPNAASSCGCGKSFSTKM